MTVVSGEPQALTISYTTRCDSTRGVKVEEPMGLASHWNRTCRSRPNRFGRRWVSLAMWLCTRRAQQTGVFAGNPDLSEWKTDRTGSAMPVGFADVPSSVRFGR